MSVAAEARSRSAMTTAAWSLLAAYSVGHFVYSAVWQAWTRVYGDFSSAFPGPFTLRVSQWFPGLMGAWVPDKMARHSWGDGSWNYGPALHLVTLPFAVASTQLQALRIILIVDYALIAWTLVIWTRILLPEPRRTVVSVAVLCVWLNHFPLLEALVGREVEIFELFLLTAAIWALRERRELLAGGAVGLAAMIKFLPVALVPYLFVKGYRRAGLAASITVAAFVVFAQVALGWEHSVTLLQARQETATAVYPTAYANQAITNVLHKTFTVFNLDDPRPRPLYPRVLRSAGTILNAAVIAATAWFVFRWRRCRLPEIEIALLMIVMCLLPSHSNTYYFVFALPALSLATAALWQPGAARMRWHAPTLAAAIALMGFLLPMRAYDIATGVPGVLVARALQGWSLPFYGAVLACSLLLQLHRIAREDPAACCHEDPIPVP